MMLGNIAQLVLDVFLQGFTGVLLLRFLLQWLRAPLRNPVGEFIMALTDFLVLRTRRYIPSFRLLDSATLLLAFFFELIYVSLTLSLQGYVFEHFPLPGLLALSIVALLRLSIYFLMGALVVQAILSWVNPYTPLAPLLAAITQRFLRPIRRIVPLIGNVDLSPLILLVICQIVLSLPLAMLENLSGQLL